MGIRTAIEANTSLLGKLVYDMVQSSSKLWVNLLSSKYSGGKNILQLGYSWHAGSGSFSFWFSNWSPHGPIGNHVPIIDIHDLHLSKYVFSLMMIALRVYTPLFQQLLKTTSTLLIFCFNDAIENTVIWANNKNGSYTTKSRYAWLLSLKATVIDSSSYHTWTWIWRLQVPEKYKFLIWLACHNASPTLSLLHHRNRAPSATCARCGDHDETFLHCVRDCRYSSNIWHKIGFTGTDFFTIQNAYDLMKNNTSNNCSTLFSAGLWWVWRNRNLMCLNNKTWSMTHLCNSIHSSKDAI